jgi:murein DD-endopeptidase MepM/ murein hydrolase activator NlpD
VVYTVAKNDTVSEIAAKYNVSVDDILKTNNIKDVTLVRIGSKLMIPGAIQKIDAKSKDTKTVAKNTQNLTPVPTPTPGKKPTVVDTKTGLKSRYVVKYTGLSRGFAWGNCTYYVAQNKSVTWR